MKEKLELNLDELKDVNGGMIVEEGEEEKKFWLIRQDGSVIAPIPSKEMAVQFAHSMSVSPDVITREEYKERFGRELLW